MENWKKRLVGDGQMSESFLVAAVLSASGGLQDAYTYLGRGGVFANAQTGNIVLLSQSLFLGQWPQVLRYLGPVLAFACGVAAAELIRARYRQAHRLHWRQLVLGVEIALLFAVAFLPHRWDTAANMLVSFACAMQVQAFRKVDGYTFASTMCIGNLRSGTESLCAWLRVQDAKALHKAKRYFGVIGLFALGAAVGGVGVGRLGDFTIWISCGLLLVSLCLMFWRDGVE